MILLYIVGVLAAMRDYTFVLRRDTACRRDPAATATAGVRAADAAASRRRFRAVHV